MRLTDWSKLQQVWNELSAPPVSTPEPRIEKEDTDMLPAFDEVVTDLFLDEVNDHLNLQGAKWLKQWAERVIDEFGSGSFAQMVTDASAHGIKVEWEDMYKEDSAMQTASALITYLQDYDYLNADEAYDLFYGGTDYDDYFDDEEVYGK